MSEPSSSSENLPQDAALVALAEKLRPAFERAGVPQPDVNATAAPALYVGSEKNRPPVQRLARDIAALLQGKDLLFVRGSQVGTIEPMTGEWREMTPHEFVTFLPDVAGIVPFKGTKNDTDERTGETKKTLLEGELGVDAARVILASMTFKRKLPVVERINRVRLPVFREALDERGDERRKGFRKIELLKEGYDAESRTYTIMSGLEYDLNLDITEAVAWVRHLLSDFQFGDEERSRAVFVQYFVTLFCQHLYEGKAPMGLFTSNLPGSGKSSLTQLCIEPVMGRGATGASGWNREDKQETRKEMDAAAQEFAPYIWFDDVDRCKVASSDLNRWITIDVWVCREIGTKRRFSGVLKAVTFMTGLAVTLDDNLERRTLVVDMFARMKASERPKAEDRLELDAGFFRNEGNMRHCLAVMWALVRLWDEEHARAGPGQRLIESFDDWCRVVGGIAKAAGFDRGLAAYEAPDAGNQEGREWKTLATALIEEFCTQRGQDRAEVTMRDVIRVARLNGLFSEKLGTLEQVLADLEEREGLKKWKWKEVKAVVDDEDPTSFATRAPDEAERRLQAAEWTDKGMDSAWAKAFRKSAVAGQYFVGKDGRMYEFGDRTSGKKSKFVIALVSRG